MKHGVRQFVFSRVKVRCRIVRTVRGESDDIDGLGVTREVVLPLHAALFARFVQIDFPDLHRVLA